MCARVPAALALAVLGLTSVVQAQFFVYGHGALTRTRLDPIVNPGTLASHVHLFAGNNALQADMSFESAQAATCTTAELSIDKSGYWIPQMYYKWKNGTFTALTNHGMTTYWFLDRGIDRKKGERPAVVPDNFRMVAGNMSRDFFDTNIPSHNAVKFPCSGEGYGFDSPYIPADRECEEMRPQIFFPNCWDGVNAYKEDNSHVAYPIEPHGDFHGGVCPPGFVRMPSLFIESHYSPKYELGADYGWYPGCFVLASGDNFGLSLHADWLNGFPSGMMAEAFDKCPGMTDGNPRGCSVLSQYVQKGKDKDCIMSGQLVNEPVGFETPLAKLPGNNPVYNSSKAANNPKVLDPNYKETSSLITFVVAQGGACIKGKCTDYFGPRSAPAESRPPIVAPISPAVSAATVRSSASATSAFLSVVMPAATVKPPVVGGSLNAEPVKLESPEAAASSTGGGDQGKVCVKRRYQKGRSQMV